ncbi:MAG TPA: FAD-linked oxidase, partial [Firmicutes bacterium]|nr:FAD-linked oxidase [Bacillota bacterium]
EHPDLFWALRGSGGQNFGVVVEHTYKLPPKLNEGSLINFDFMHCEKETMKQIVMTYQALFQHLDRRMNMKLGMYNSMQKGYGIRITGLFYGTRNEAIQILEPILKFVTPQTIWSIDEMSILEANRDIQDSHPDYENYKSSGRFVYQAFTEPDLDMFFEIIKERAVGAYYTAISLYGLGGAVAEKSKEETAFYYRDALFILGFQSVWDNNEVANRNIEWFLPRFEQLKSITKGTFVNFPSLQL